MNKVELRKLIICKVEDMNKHDLCDLLGYIKNKEIT